MPVQHDSRALKSQCGLHTVAIPGLSQSWTAMLLLIPSQMLPRIPVQNCPKATLTPVTLGGCWRKAPEATGSRGCSEVG